MFKFPLFFVFLIAMPALTVADEIDLDGVYTESATMIDRQGEETQALLWDHAVLEFQGDQFKYWHFSDRISSTKYPIIGKFTRDGDKVELISEKLSDSEKRYVATSIKGVTGIWPEKELADWRAGKHPTWVPILVRVAEGPVGEKLDQSTFKFPSVTPLFDIAAAERYWTEEQKEHENRYMDLDEPLRTLLRERSSRDDMSGYEAILAKHQKQMPPKLVKQLMAETGKGVSIVVGPLALKDLYGCGYTFTSEPAFSKNDASKRAALQILVDAMPEANNGYALNAALHVFLQTTGLEEINLSCDDGTTVKRKRSDSYSTHSFKPSVAEECSRWANERLVELFRDTE